MVVSFPACATYWFSYEMTKYHLKRLTNGSVPDTTYHFLGGVMAETTSNIVR